MANIIRNGKDNKKATIIIAIVLGVVIIGTIITAVIVNVVKKKKPATPSVTTTSAESTNDSMVGTQITSPDKNPLPSPTTTTTETTEGTTQRPAASEPLDVYYQKDPNNANLLKRTVIPGHKFADKNVPAYPHISKLACLYIEGGAQEDTVFSIYVVPNSDGTYTPVDPESDDYDFTGNEIECEFILDGINLPFDPAKEEYISNKFNLSYSFYMGSIINYQFVYFESDFVPDSNNKIHGYAYIKPEKDETALGRVIHTEDLIQINELLLAMGFAEPDKNYTGPYAEIYAQYPSFKDNYEGYPMIDAISKDDMYDKHSVAFYYPEHEAEYYPFAKEIGYNFD